MCMCTRTVPLHVMLYMYALFGTLSVLTCVHTFGGMCMMCVCILYYVVVFGCKHIVTVFLIGGVGGREFVAV